MSKRKLHEAKGGADMNKEISPAAREIIDSLPEEQKSVILRSMTIAEYHGPIPPPSLLKEYNEIIPNAADRILAMAESEQKHRHKSMDLVVRSSIIRRVFGLIFGVTLIFCIIIGAYKLAMAGHDGVAGTMVSVTIISLASIFVLNREPTHDK